MGIKCRALEKGRRRVPVEEEWNEAAVGKKDHRKRNGGMIGVD